MSTYAKLDDLIVSAIQHKSHPLYNGVVSAEADRIAQLTGREAFRVIDGRMSALRKAGRIRFVRGQRFGWEVVSAYDHEHHQRNAQATRRARLAVGELF